MFSPEKNPITSTRVVVEHGYDIALLQRVSSSEFKGAWELPGGKVEPGEDIAVGAARETEEELGMAIELLPFQPMLIEKRTIQDGKHRGRNYTSYGFLAMAGSREITFRPDEHQDAIWLPPQEALALPHLTPTSFQAIKALGALLSSPIKEPLS